MESRADRLRKARISRGYVEAKAAAEAYGWNVNTYISNENGNAEFSYKKAKEYAAGFGVRPDWLYDGIGSMHASVPEVRIRIVGQVGADSSGEILFADGHAGWDTVPPAPGGSDKASALEVKGHSMPGYADDGALIYFEDQVTKPTADMFGHVVVVETAEGEVLLKRLQNGSKPGLVNLESISGPTLRDRRLRWAAHVTGIIPPAKARRIIVRAGEAA